IYTRVKDIWTQYQPQIIMAKSTAEALKYLAEAKKAFEKAGYDKTLKYMTAKWQENLKRMSSD
ncbi:MAG: ABC transporter substrate-binding protein, partial [Firmicutes bacterium]|nr:ABC transporter substrate-binding protein [Bacillota bacterium]